MNPESTIDFSALTKVLFNIWLIWTVWDATRYLRGIKDALEKISENQNRKS